MVPHDQSVILAGESWWGDELSLDRPILPFTEKDGTYRGDPADDAAALAELKTHRPAQRFSPSAGPHSGGSAIIKACCRN